MVIDDECDSQKHEDFVRAFASRGSRLAVITLSDEIRSVAPPSSVFCVKPLGKPQIETILRTEAPALPENVVSRVAEFADGYPRIATLLAESYQTSSGSPEEFFTISDEALMNRLIAGRADVNSDHFRKTKKVLSGLSVFRNVDHERKQFLLELKKVETNVKVKRWINEYISLVTEETKLARIEEEKRGF